ncbi:hypothetical protein BD413DRAFT_614568 [Trametes elegans]|nr:hypothetical protein BD413DRAFT_614568 [Trametes elegans]
MPSLRSVSLEAFSDVEHGIPWPVLEAILTVPHLEAFSCRYHNLSPAAFHRPGAAFAGISQALTRFEFTLTDYRRPPRMYQPERSTLDFVLQECHERLEVLTIPAECAPFHTMCDLDWPALRELRLRGVIEPGNEPADPFVVAFACMPRLRVLELRLALPPTATPKPLWPAGVEVTYPWPELQELVVSFPEPDDLLWHRLPSGLRSLTLTYFPHLSTHLWAMENHRVDWHWPPTKPADLLRILQACSIPALDRLGLEYHADDDEDALLSYVGTAYSQLTALKVFRYQIPLGTHRVDIANLVRPLRSLTCLTTLQLHLDLPETGYITAEFMRYIAREYMMAGENPAVLFDRALNEAANLLARHVGPSVEVVKLPRRDGGESNYEWVAYKVVRDTEGGPRAQSDEYLTYGQIQAPAPDVSNARPDSESRDSEAAERFIIVIPPHDLRPVIIGA